MKGLKKVLCLVLSLAMVLTSLTVTAFAANTSNKIISTNSTIKMSGNYYGSTSSGTKTGIALTVNNGITATIDLNGWRIYFGGSSYSTIINNGTLSLTDTNPNGQSTSGATVNYIYNLNTSKSTPAVIQNNGTLTLGKGIKAANMNTTSTNTTPVVDKGPTIDNSGTLYITDDAVIAGNIVNETGGSISITGGYFYAEPDASWIADGYKAIEDTTQTGCNYRVVEKYKTINYYDGETKLDISTTEAPYLERYTLPTPTKDGYTFTGWNTQADGSGTAYQGGATITVADDMTLYAQWVAGKVVASVTVGDTTTNYTDIASAAKAAATATTDGGTANVTLIDDIDVTSRINFTTSAIGSDTVKRTINLDLNGHTINSSADNGAIAQNRGAKLNVYDNSSAGTGAIVRTNASNDQYFWSVGYSGTEIKVYGGTYSGAKYLCNRGNNTNSAFQMFGGKTNTIATADGNSPFPTGVGSDIVDGTYYVAAASVTVDGATNYFPTFEEARTYLVNNVDAGETGTIKLLADQSVSSRILLYKSWSSTNTNRTIYFDLNGHTLSSTAALTSGIISQNCNDTTYIEDTSDEKSGTISMYDGSTYYFHTPRYTNMYYISDVTLTGGTQIGPDAALGSNTYYNITSGTYNFDPTNYLADDTVTAINNGDGTWIVDKKANLPYVVTYSDDSVGYFKTYNDALNSALSKSDKTATIKIYATALDETFALNDSDADITLDFNNANVVMSGEIPFASLTAGNMTIKNATIDLTGKSGDAATIKVAKGSALTLTNTTIKYNTTPIVSSGVVVVDGKVGASEYVKQEGTDAKIQTVSGGVTDSISLTITAAIAITDSDAEITMQYVANKKTIKVDGTCANGIYTFKTEEGVCLTNLDEDLEIQFLADGESLGEVSHITIQDYLNAVYAADPDNTTQNAFMAEMIDFAKKLQKYNDGSSTIEFAGWEEENLIDVTPTSEDNIKEITIPAVSDKNKIRSMYLVVQDKVNLNVNLYITKGTRAVVTLDDETVFDDISGNGNTNTIVLGKISPLDYDSEYVITLYDGNSGATIYQAKYSVNSYAYYMISDELAGDAILAMYRYGKAAEYFNQEGELSFGEVSYVWNNMGTTCSASRTSIDGTVTQSETVTATRETVTEGSGNIASIVKTTADFVNPAFETQVTTAPATKAANLEGSKTQTAWEKHLITNDDGSIGGSFDATTYGEGAPLNGALDNVSAGYYATNDYYNTKCTDTRSILTNFAGYQQTMAYTDGIASVRMALNYCDSTFAASNSEKDMLDKFESLNSSYSYGDAVSSAELKTFVESYGYTAEIPTSTTDWTKFETLIKNTIDSGKIMLIKWQQAETARWCVVIGIDTMGDNKTNGDPVILAVPFDAYDQYQDGYQCVALPILCKWWKTQTTAGPGTTGEALIITPNDSISLQTVGDGESDNIKTNPFYAEKHLLLNSDGTSGGELNSSLYGSEGTALNGTYKLSDGTYQYVDAPEYNYFGKADYYNMSDTSTLSLCENFQVFQQTMASSCGLSSTLHTLNYLGYDFTKLDNYVKHVTSTTQNAYQEGEIAKVTLSDGTTEVGHFDKVQEALLNIYMQTDSNFADGTTKFNNYGSVGAKTLHNVGVTIGLNPGYGNFSVGSSPSVCYPTYASFKSYIQGRLSQNLPTVISWAPGVGHWETIIGFDDMGTDSPYDDVVVLADSADTHDQYQDGYNTYPASQFYAQWYNGTGKVGQAHVEYSALS